ncbi:kinase super protein, partial [Cymbomonas tetramitiformis]
AADVWSLGVKLHVMLTQRYPFAHPSSPLNDRLMLKQVVKYWKGEVEYEPPPRVSDACKDTLRWMLAADPAKRMTVQQMLEWPWFEMAAECREAPCSPCTPKRPPLEDLTAIFEMAKKNPTKVDPLLTQTDDCSDIENSDYEDDSDLIE